MRSNPALVLLCVATAPLLFLLNLLPHVHLPYVYHWRDGWGLPEWAEWLIYLHGWPSSVIVAFGMCWAVRKWGQQLAAETVAFYNDCLVAGNSLLAVLFVGALFLCRGSKELAGVPALFPFREAGAPWAQSWMIIIAYAIAYAVLNIVLLVLARRLDCRIAAAGGVWPGAPALQAARLISRTCCAFLPVVALASLCTIFLYPPYHAIIGTVQYKECFPLLLQPPIYKWVLLGAVASSMAGSLVLGVAPGVFAKLSLAATGSRGMRVLCVVLEVCALAALCALLFDTSFEADSYHGNIYLQSANAVMHGRCAPNEVNTLYGVGPTYLLAAIFSLHLLPFSLPGMSAFNSLCYITLYLVMYFKLRISLRQRLIPFLAVLGAAAWVYNGYYVLLPGFRPCQISQGPPLRIGLTAMLLLVVAIRHATPRRLTSTWLLVAEGICVGLASVWSLEALVYTGMAYLAVVLCETFLSRRTVDREYRMVLGRRLRITACLVLLTHGAFAAFTLWHWRQLPRWDWYVEFALHASETSSPIAPWGAWQILVLLLFVCAMWIVLTLVPRFGFPAPSVLPVVSGLTVLGILHFTYFLGYSLGFRITYLLYAPMCLAATLVALGRQHRDSIPRWLRNGLAFFFSMAVFTPVLLVFFKPADANPFNYSLLKDAVVTPFQHGRLQQVRSRMLRLKPHTGITLEAVEMVRKYAPGRDRLPLFLDAYGRDSIDVFMHVGGMHTFPITSAEHDGEVESVRKRILEYPHDLRDGDVIFVRKGLNEGFLVDVLLRLYREFSWTVLETSPHGVQAVQLKSRPAPLEATGAPLPPGS